MSTGRGRKIRFGLRFKVILTSIIPMLAAIASFIWISRFRFREELDRHLSRHLIALSKSISAVVTAEWLSYLNPEDRNSRAYQILYKKLSDLKELLQVRRIYIFDEHRGIILDTAETSPSKKLELMVEADAIKAVLMGEPKASILFRDRVGQWYKTGFAPIFGKDGLKKKKVIAIAAVEGSANFFYQIKSIQKEILFYGVLALFLTIIVGSTFSSRLLAPLGKLVSAAEKIGEGNLNEKVSLQNDDELGILAETMEEMRKRILARDRQMKMMLSGIAHEVRNSLGGMELFAGILSEELKEEPDKEKHVRKIQKELRYLAEVVNTFLDYAKPIELQLESTDISELIAEIVSFSSGDAESEGVKIKLQTIENIIVKIDRGRLRQVLFNLIQNAVQAYKGNGGVIEISTRKSSNYVHIDIADFGPGIPDDIGEKIFEPFFTTKEKGTGLGLPLAKKLLSAHGGDISFKKNPNDGTIFTVKLPLNTN